MSVLARLRKGGFDVAMKETDGHEGFKQELTTRERTAAGVGAPLTETERDVIRLACGGLKDCQIAGRLHTDEAAVRDHFASIYRKFGLSNRLELVIYAYLHGLAELPV